MSFEDRLGQARAALVAAVNPVVSPGALDRRAAVVARRRRRRQAGIGVAAVALFAAAAIPLVWTSDSPVDVTSTGPEPAMAADEGDPAGESSRPEPEPEAPDEPPTAPPTTARQPGEAPMCPNFVADPEEVPEQPGGEELIRAQERYMADARTMRRYGDRHPGDFVDLKFANTPHVRLVVAFTQNLAVHCENLRAILEHPDDFELWRMPWTQRYLDHVQDSVAAGFAEFGTASRGYGRHWAGPVEAYIRADGEALARSLHERFGDAVVLHVGLHPYPRNRITGPSRACEAPLSAEAPVLSGVEVTLELDDVVVAPGKDGTGTLTVRNTGLDPITVSMRPRSGVVVLPGTTEIVSVLDVWGGPSVGYPDMQIEAGESVEVPVRFGTAACDASAGYALATGSYEVVAAVEIHRGGEMTEVSSEPAVLQVE